MGSQVPHWNTVTAIYQAEKTAATSGSRYNFGVKTTPVETHHGINTNDCFSWSVFPRGNTNSVTPNISLSTDLTNSSNGWVFTNTNFWYWYHNSNLTNEIILRHPLVNNFNNKKAYESSVHYDFNTSEIGEFNGEKFIPRGRSDYDTYGNGKNYGAGIPWALYSGLIVDDVITDISDVTSGSAMDYFNMTQQTGGSTLTWSKGGTNQYFYPSCVVDTYSFDSDGYTDGDSYGGTQSDGTPLQWLSSGPDHKIGIDTLVPALANPPIDVIRIAPASNCQWSDEGDDAYLNVDPVKTLKVTLRDGTSWSSPIIRQYTIHFQPWQTSDIVIIVNPEGDAEHAIYPEMVEFQILEVWDDDYSQMNKGTGTASDNFGGIAEVYLYGRTVTSYEPLESKIIMMDAAEDSIRYSAKEIEGAFNGGKYWVPLGESEHIGYRAYCGGSYNIAIAAIENDKDTTGSLRYNCNMATTFQTMSIDFSAQLAKDVETEYWEQFWNNLWRLVIMVVAAAVVGAFLWGAGAVIFGTTLTTGGILMGMASKFVWSAIFGLAMVSGVIGISTINPTLAWGISTFILEVRDVVAALAISGLCHLLDVVISPKECFFRENLGPLLYGLYMYTLDLDGTVARGATMIWAEATGAFDSDEMIYLTFDDYEIALMSGEAFNWLDYFISGGT